MIRVKLELAPARTGCPASAFPPGPIAPAGSVIRVSYQSGELA